MTAIKEAIILAGGLGTRLRQTVPDLPKPLARVCGRPFLEYVLDHIRAHGIEKVILSTGYMHKSIEGHFGKGYRDMTIEYAFEDEPLGTGGALRKALSLADDENLFALNGDSLFRVDMKSMAAFHLEKNALLTLAVKPGMDAGRRGSVLVEDSMVKGFIEKGGNGGTCDINAGVYAINRKCAGLMRGLGKSFSFEKDFLEKGLARAFAYPSAAYFIDIGIPEDYLRAQYEGEFIKEG